QRSQVKPKHFRSPLGRLALLAGAGLLLLVTGCSRNEPGLTTAAESNPAAATNSPAAAAPSDFAATLPHVGGPAGYVGSKSCRSCHADQFDSWHRSYHRTMTQF